MLHRAGAVPRMALGNVALPCGTRCIFSYPNPSIFSQISGVHLSTLAAQHPLPGTGGVERGCIHRGRERSALGSSGALPLENHAWARTWQPPPQNMAKGHRGTGSCSICSTAPLGRALGALRTPWHRCTAFDRPWLVHKASPSSLPVPPPPHGQPLAALPSPAARVPLGWTCVKIIKDCLAWSRPEDPGRACHGEQRRRGCFADVVAAPAAHVPVLALQRPLPTHHHPRSSPDKQHTARGAR